MASNCLQEGFLPANHSSLTRNRVPTCPKEGFFLGGDRATLNTEFGLHPAVEPL